jgi:HlyD family secretion protein
LDREIAPEIRRKAKLKRYSTMGTMLVCFVAGLYGLNIWLSPKIERSKIRTAVVEIGNVEASFTALGIVVPAFEQIMTSPVNSKIKHVLKNAGETIEKGNQVLELDTEFLEIELGKLRDEYELKQNKKRQLTLAIEDQKLRLRSQQDIKQLNIQFLETKFEKEKRLHELGLGPKANFQQAELELAIAKREMRLLQEQTVNQGERLNADLHELELELKIQRKRIAELQKKIELAQAKSDYSGVLTWVNTNVGSSVQVGETIAKVADLSRFKVEAKVSDMYSDKIHAGDPVKVRINDTDLSGNINRVRPAVEDGVVVFVVELDDPQNPLLKSNLRVDVFVITSSVRQVMRVRNGPFYQGGSYQKVFVVEGDTAIAREVTIGATNFDYIEIKEGLAPGEELIISNMEDYLHHAEIRLE